MASAENLDLETAEALLIAAGKPELAQALRFQAQGVRNLVQGEWGKAFVGSFEGLLVRHITPLVEGQAELLSGQKETHSSVTALSEHFQALSEIVDQLETGYHNLNERHAGQIQTLTSDIASIKSVMEARPAQRLKEQAAWEKRLKSMESRLAALEAGYAQPKS